MSTMSGDEQRTRTQNKEDIIYGEDIPLFEAWTRPHVTWRQERFIRH